VYLWLPSGSPLSLNRFLYHFFWFFLHPNCQNRVGSNAMSRHKVHKVFPPPNGPRLGRVLPPAAQETQPCPRPASRSDRLPALDLIAAAPTDGIPDRPGSKTVRVGGGWRPGDGWMVTFLGARRSVFIAHPSETSTVCSLQIVISPNSKKISYFESVWAKRTTNQNISGTSNSVVTSVDYISSSGPLNNLSGRGLNSNGS